MRWLSYFVLCLAFLASALHAPAIAHSGALLSHADQHSHAVDHGDVEIAGQVDPVDDANAPDSSESGKHQHSPSALANLGAGLVAAATLNQTRPLPSAVTILVSSSEAPPTEPPSA